MQATVKWQGKMAFIGEDEAGHSVKMDAPPAVGGENDGFRPKQLLLDSLAGCTSMDVISILKKMKITPDSFMVEVEAGESEEHPKVFTDFHIKYLVSGDVPEAKLNKAINLSQERYCGVTAMFRSFAPITHEVIYTD
ncbi:MAG: OsmC family protein [Gammaproteobacteria bacterium]|nr:OsmC family protein [Gammaproteobacteria bacterium]